MAIYPLVVPLMASPMGLVVLTAISANTQLAFEEFAILTGALLVVMAINLVALLSVDAVTKYLNVETLEVANRILALLLAALAMETIIIATGDLAGQVLGRLQEMGLIGK
jgi:multiple antibiotic resistance protein